MSAGSVIVAGASCWSSQRSRPCARSGDQPGVASNRSRRASCRIPSFFAAASRAVAAAGVNERRTRERAQRGIAHRTSHLSRRAR